MNRALVVLWLSATPLASAAQPYVLQPPSIGEALRQMDRVHALAGGRGLPAGRRLDQVYVLPERPGQNQVAWYDFDWHYLDVPSPSGGRGGIRLYYYGRERTVAELALPVIRNAYLRLVDEFHYTPTQRIPYILYASQREFQATNVFQVTESVLGVTSPQDLKMSLPYFGDHDLFRAVSTHELVHQFTIQKLLDLSESDDAGSPFESLPLWFIEGMAEYYSKGGLDPESDGYLRDVVWNPDTEHHYALTGFADDRHRGYVPTYKLGQARITFIAEVYGKEKIQEYLENAGAIGRSGQRGFAALTRRVLNEPIEQVDVRWRAWVKRRYYPEYGTVRQDLAQLEEVRDLPAEPEAFSVSPDGTLLFMRGLEREQGRVKLFLVDARHPATAVEVARDDRPGIESLHPIEHSVMAITDGALAFTAQSGAGDVLYYQRYVHRPRSHGRGPELRLLPRTELRVVHPRGRRFIEMWDPAFSPDGTELAFVGITDLGQQDIYVVPARGGVARQLTDDPFAEHDLAWGDAGIYCASDATDHGLFNLFRVDAATGARTRLTTGNWNDHHPRPQPDGSVLYSSDAGGKTDLYLLRDGATRRITDFTTVLTAPASAPRARGIWASTFYRGRFRVVEVPRVAWLDEPPVPVPPAVLPVLAFPRAEIPAGTPAYEPYSLGNWRPEAGIVYGGGASSGVAGSAALLFSDVLRDRQLLLDLSVYGSFDYTEALALLEDRSARTSWYLGGFHFVRGQIDLTDPALAYLQRDFGVLGGLRFPLDRFRRVETELSAGGVQRYCPTDFTVDTFTTCGPLLLEHDDIAGWHARNDGVSPQVGPTFRYGYDTVRFDVLAGPISGDALLLELGGGWLPWRSAVHGFARADAVKYWRIYGRSKLMLRVAGGTSLAPSEASKQWARTWWLTSADNLRGYGPFDLAYLIGQNYYVANAELQIPLDWFIRLALFDAITGVAAVDFGGVFDRFSSTCATASDCTASNAGAWESRTLTAVLGFNVLFGPLLLRVHFGHPIDIHGIRTPALRNGTSWVTNITLRYFFF